MSIFARSLIHYALGDAVRNQHLLLGLLKGHFPRKIWSVEGSAVPGYSYLQMLSAVRLEARKLTRPVDVHIRLGFAEDVSLGCSPETVWFVSGSVNSFGYASTVFKNAAAALLPVIRQKLKDLSFAVDFDDNPEGDLYDMRWHGTPSTTLPFAARDRFAAFQPKGVALASIDEFLSWLHQSARNLEPKE